MTNNSFRLSVNIKKHFLYDEKILTLRAGFEPARALPIGFQVQRLNHSAITAANNIDNT